MPDTSTAVGVREARLARLVEMCRPYDAEELSLDGRPSRFLLIEEERPTGRFAFSTHETLAAAARYWDANGDTEYWELHGVVDLDTGLRYSGETTTTLTADPNAAPKITDAMLTVDSSPTDSAAPGDVLDQVHAILTSSRAADDVLGDLADLLTSCGRPVN